MMSLSDDKQADVIDAFNTTSRYLDDILNISCQFPILDGDIPRSTSYGVYISQLILLLEHLAMLLILTLAINC